MKKSTRQTDNFVDVLATELQFAVLTKPGRIQILVKPTAKQLRKRGKRGWSLFGSVDNHLNSEQALNGILREAILKVEPEDGAENKKGKKRKATETAADK
jgi:hypothetical protein